MPVDQDPAHTVCVYHTLIYPKELGGSQRLGLYSQCEKERQTSYGCKYSHTIFNIDRVHELGSQGGQRSYVVSLEYGHGYERYGGYEWFDSGWEVKIVPDVPWKDGVRYARLRHNLPKVLLAEEARTGLRKRGDAPTPYAKVQSLCRAHDERDACMMPDCRFDHDLVDSARIERLVRWPPENASNYDALTVECRVVEGDTTWKITLKEAVFAGLKATDPIARRIPSRPYSYESEELLDVIRHMERVVGLAK